MGLITLHNWRKGIEQKKEKTCARCKELKPLVDFSPGSTNLDGKSSYCKPCNVERQAERYKQTLKVKKGFFDPNERMF